MLWVLFGVWLVLTLAAAMVLAQTYQYERTRKRELGLMVDRIVDALTMGQYGRTEIVKWQIHLMHLRFRTPLQYHRWLNALESARAEKQRQYEGVRDGRTEEDS